jgi:hypothetical protein
MATLYVTEFTGPFVNRSTGLPMARGPKTAQNNQTIGGTSTNGNAFAATTYMIRVHTDAICSVEVGGTSPTATAASSRMVAGQTEYYYVTPGHKIATITNT